MVSCFEEEEGRSLKATLPPSKQPTAAASSSSLLHRFSFFSQKARAPQSSNAVALSSSYQKSSWLPGLFGVREASQRLQAETAGPGHSRGDVFQTRDRSSGGTQDQSTRDAQAASSFSLGGAPSRGWGMPLRVSASADRGSVRGDAAKEEARDEKTGGRVWPLAWLGRKKESDKAVSVRPAAFERRRKRYRTVSWKYKKSIGMSASFVFVCNQILASGLTSMPVTLIEYGWLPPLLMNLLFCFLSSMCSLLLLHSVNLIENNQNFDERFEYSATLRHFLAPSSTSSSALSPLGREGGHPSSASGVASPFCSSSPLSLFSTSAGFLEYLQHHAGPAPLLRRLLASISQGAGVSSAHSEGGQTAGEPLASALSDGKEKKAASGEEDSPLGEDVVCAPRRRPDLSGSFGRRARCLFSRQTWKVILHHLAQYPSNCMRWLYNIATRPPPLLPPRFPRALTMLLYLNTFLSTCSAALLVAYCIDCLLLRIFSRTLFLPLLPTHVVPYNSLSGAAEWAGASCALLMRPFLLVLGPLNTLLVSLIDTVVSPLLTTLYWSLGLTDTFPQSESGWAMAGGAHQAFLRFLLPGFSFRSAGNEIGPPNESAIPGCPASSSFLWGEGAAVCPERTSSFASEGEVASFSLLYWLWPLNILHSLGLSDFFLSLLNSVISGYKLEAAQTYYSLSSVPFVFSLPSQHQIEEVFSGVCTPDCDGETGVSSMSLLPSAIASMFISSPPGAEGDLFSASSVGATSRVLAGEPSAECLPCVGHMGITVGYLITAAICLHLAVSDLQDNMRLQFLSFGAIIAAVVQISGSAALTLFRIAPSSFSLVASSSPALSSLPVVPPTSVQKGEGASIARLASDANLHASGLFGGMQVGQKGAAGEEAGTGGFFRFSSWPEAVVRGSGMGSLVSTFVDAYSFSNALPSWANEVKDDVPVTRTIFTSTVFSCATYFLFGLLCAAAFPAPSASSNVLAAMLPSCTSLVAVGCICFFHVFALLPSIVTSQISCRYDLINMAICLDKQSAFFTASIMPWFLYWLLTFSPLFALPSSLLTLTTNVLLNFVAPALVFVYALHASSSSGEWLEPDESLLAVDESGADLFAGEENGSLPSVALSDSSPPTSSASSSLLKHPDTARCLQGQSLMEGAAPSSLASRSTDAGSFCPSSSGKKPATPLKSCLRVPGAGGSGSRAGGQKQTTVSGLLEPPEGPSNLPGNPLSRRQSWLSPGELSPVSLPGRLASLDPDAPAFKRASTHDVSGEGERSFHLQVKKSGGGSSNGGSGKGRVSGAVAGGGGARSREVQRQLHEWLQEYSRQMPDSEVAQLLQQQQKEEEEEQRRLRTEGEEETHELRKKQLGNEWLRRHALGEHASPRTGDTLEEGGGVLEDDGGREVVVSGRETEEVENDEAAGGRAPREEMEQRRTLVEDDQATEAAAAAAGQSKLESKKDAELGEDGEKAHVGAQAAEAVTKLGSINKQVVENGTPFSKPVVALSLPRARTISILVGKDLDDRNSSSAVKIQKAVILAAERAEDFAPGSGDSACPSFERARSRRMSMKMRTPSLSGATLLPGGGALARTATMPPCISGGPQCSVGDASCAPPESRETKAQDQEEVRQPREPRCGTDVQGPGGRSSEDASLLLGAVAPGDIPVEFASPSEAGRFVRRTAKTSRIDPALLAVQARMKAKQREGERRAGLSCAVTNEPAEAQASRQVTSNQVLDEGGGRCGDAHTKASWEEEEHQHEEAGTVAHGERPTEDQSHEVSRQTEEEECKENPSRAQELLGDEVRESKLHAEKQGEDQGEQDTRGTLRTSAQAPSSTVKVLAPGEIPVEFASASEAGRFVRRKGKTSCIDPAALARQKMKEDKERARRLREENDQARKCNGDLLMREDQADAAEPDRCSLREVEQGEQEDTGHEAEQTDEVLHRHRESLFGPGKPDAEPDSPAGQAGQSVQSANRIVAPMSPLVPENDCLQGSLLGEQSAQSAEEHEKAKQLLLKPLGGLPGTAEERLVGNFDRESSTWTPKEAREHEPEVKCFRGEEAEAKHKDWSTGSNGDVSTSSSLSYLQERSSFSSVRSASSTVCDSSQSECGSSSSLSDRHADVNSPGGCQHLSPQEGTAGDLSSSFPPQINVASVGNADEAEEAAEKRNRVQITSPSTSWDGPTESRLNGVPSKAISKAETPSVSVESFRHFLTGCGSSLSARKVSTVFLSSLFSTALLGENRTKRGAGREGPRGVSLLVNATDQTSPRRPRVVAFPFLKVPEQKLVATYVLLLVICFCAFAALAEDAHEVLEICAFYLLMACVYLLTVCFEVVAAVFGGVWTAIFTLLAHAFTFAAPLCSPVRDGLWSLYVVAVSPAFLFVVRFLKLQEAVEFWMKHGTSVFSLIAGNRRGSFLGRLLGSVVRRLAGGVWAPGFSLREEWAGNELSDVPAGVGRGTSSLSSIPDLGPLVSPQESRCLLAAKECGHADSPMETGGVADDGDEGLWSFEAFFLTLVVLVLSCVPLLYYVGAYRRRAERRKAAAVQFEATQDEPSHVS